jgi:hypothetical protein
MSVVTNILLNSPSSKSENFISIFKAAENKVSLDVLTQTSLMGYYKKFQNINEVHNLIETLDINDNSIRERYKIPEDLPINLYIEYDRFLSILTTEQALNIACHHCLYVEKLLAENNYDAIIGEIGGLVHSLLYWFGNKKGIPFIWPLMSFWEDRFFITSGDENAWFNNLSAFIISESDILKYQEKAKFYKEEMKSKKPKMVHIEDEKSTYEVSKLVFKFIIKSPKKINSLIKNIFFKKYSYLERSLSFIIINKYFNKFNYYLFEKKYLSNKVDLSCKYILFYLHYEPDLSTIVWAPYIKNQLEAIKNISFSIPNGYKLYIKEHPLSVGTRDRGFYKTIVSNHNVKLINSSFDGKKLLENTDCVVTITGSIGNEAMYFNKPIITLGNVYYNDFIGTKNVTDFSKLKEEILKSIKDKNYTEKDVEIFIIKLLAFTYEGDYYKTVVNPENLQNSKKISNSILEYINRAKNEI